MLSHKMKDLSEELILEMERLVGDFRDKKKLSKNEMVILMDDLFFNTLAENLGLRIKVEPSATQRPKGLDVALSLLVSKAEPNVVL